MCECADVWMCGCVDVWICGFVDLVTNVEIAKSQKPKAKIKILK